MNPIKYLTSLLKSFAAFITLGAAACGFTFATALLLRCLVRAWHAGWTLALVTLSSFCILHSTMGTPVLFTSVDFAAIQNSRNIILMPDPVKGIVLAGTNLVAFHNFVLHPVNGSVTQNLLPWGYTLAIDGWPYSAHIVVPNSTNVLNAGSLVTNGVAIWYGFTNYAAYGTNFVTVFSTNTYNFTNSTLVLQTNIYTVVSNNITTSVTNYAWTFVQSYTNVTVTTNFVTINSTNIFNQTNAVTVSTTNLLGANAFTNYSTAANFLTLRVAPGPLAAFQESFLVDNLGDVYGTTGTPGQQWSIVNGVATVPYFVGDGSGITNLLGGATVLTNNASLYSITLNGVRFQLGAVYGDGSGLNNLAYANFASAGTVLTTDGAGGLNWLPTGLPAIIETNLSIVAPWVTNSSTLFHGTNATSFFLTSQSTPLSNGVVAYANTVSTAVSNGVSLTVTNFGTALSNQLWMTCGLADTNQSVAVSNGAVAYANSVSTTVSNSVSLTATNIATSASNGCYTASTTFTKGLTNTSVFVNGTLNATTLQQGGVGVLTTVTTNANMVINGTLNTVGTLTSPIHQFQGPANQQWQITTNPVNNSLVFSNQIATSLGFSMPTNAGGSAVFAAGITATKLSQNGVAIGNAAFADTNQLVVSNLWVNAAMILVTNQSAPAVLSPGIVKMWLSNSATAGLTNPVIWKSWFNGLGQTNVATSL